VTAGPRRVGLRRFIVSAALVALLLAGIVSFYASSQPDGLEKVATDEGFIDEAAEHDLAEGPLADYNVSNVDDARLSVGLSGVMGVVLTLGIGGAVFWWLGRRSAQRDTSRGAAAPAAGERRQHGGLRGRGHVAALHVPGPSPLHRLPAHAKTAAAVLAVVGVVATPPSAWWAFVLYAAVLASLARVGRIPQRVFVRRLALELPVVAFAVLLPIVGGGERVEVLSVSLSEAGLLAAWNLLAKATLGLATMVVLTATTPVPDLVRGLGRLRLPTAIVAIAGLMVRYLDVIAADLRRMQVARVSRAHDPRWLWQVGAVASTLGTLFVRTYERGERIHLAMASRGGDGSVAVVGAPAATRVEWAVVLSLPALTASVAVAARLVG
jgi:cobalt/nickel transport system permease protein